MGFFSKLIGKQLKKSVKRNTKVAIDAFGIDHVGRKKDQKLKSQVRKGTLSLTKYKKLWKEDKDIQSQPNIRLAKATHDEFCAHQKLKKTLEKGGHSTNKKKGGKIVKRGGF